MILRHFYMSKTTIIRRLPLTLAATSLCITMVNLYSSSELSTSSELSISSSELVTASDTYQLLTSLSESLVIQYCWLLD